MWQRVQTLYIALATVLLAVLFFSPMALVIGSDSQTAEISYMDKTPFFVLLSIAALANVVALFLFRHRMPQMRLTVVAALILVGFQVWLAFDYFKAPDGIVFKYNVIFPAMAAIFDFLAVKGIFSDELMVRSASRLRAAKRKR